MKLSTTGKIVNEGGAVELVPSWKTKVALWLDASQNSTFYMAKEHLANDIDWAGLGITEQTAPDNSLYEWNDCRSWQRDVSLRSVIFDNFKNNPAYASSVFPTIPSDGNAVRWKSSTSGKPRLTLGGKSHTDSSPNNVSILTKCIVAVFSAQDGGGTAMFMEKKGRLKRTTSTSSNTSQAAWPICLDTTVSARTNGVSVATGTGETGFTGDWQLVTLTTADALEIIGLGHAQSLNTGNGNGGQTYSEILIFDEEPTAAEREAAERYLAAKWNLPYAGSAAADETLSVSGSGTVKLSGNATLDTTDYYAGAVDLNGQRLAIGSVKLPFKAAEIPSANRLLWVDPSLAGAVVFSDDAAKPDEIKTLYTRDNGGLLTADGSYCLTSPYMEGIENTNNNRRVRLADGWLDFCNGYTADDTRGNALFLQQLPTATMQQYDDTAKELSNVAAGFFALDSSRSGGGSLMLSTARGNDKILRARTEKADAPIWALESGSTVTIDTRLNGAAVEMTDPFSGGKDVLSFNVNNSTSLLVKCYGRCNPGTKSVVNKEILGEWILYSANVSSADRERIEAYLAMKWKGELMDGFSETRDLTVSGAGVIAVADAASLPKFGASFAGSVELTATAYSFTLSATGTDATDAIVIADQTVALPANVTVNVNATGVKAGTYRLMSFGTLSPGTTFALGTVTDPRSREVVLSVRDNALYATVKPNGVILMLR